MQRCFAFPVRIRGGGGHQGGDCRGVGLPGCGHGHTGHGDRKVGSLHCCLPRRQGPFCIFHRREWMVSKGLVMDDKVAFKRFLHRMWFSLYPRSRRTKSSCAFEHVFLGEVHFHHFPQKRKQKCMKFLMSGKTRQGERLPQLAVLPDGGAEGRHRLLRLQLRALLQEQGRGHEVRLRVGGGCQTGENLEA